QGWSDSLGRQLLVMSSQGVSSAQIRLDPPELGSLTVKIQVSADQQTNVSFVSQHAVVREALEQQLNRLQDLFRDQGLNLQDVSVSDQSPQQRDGEGGGQHGGNGGSGRDEQDPGVGEPVMVRSESLIDFYA
ncbi:flagellar hook-length control protein FliK, partial [Pseudohongiella sp.]